MDKKIWMGLLIALVCLFTIGLSEDVEAATTKLDVINFTTGTIVSGTANFSCNLSYVPGVSSGAGINITWEAYGPDGSVMYNLTTKGNESANQSFFGILYDTTKLPDQDLYLRCKAWNYTPGNAFGLAVATSDYVQIVIDNTALSISPSSTVDDWNATTRCPKKTPLRWQFNASDDEQIDGDPVLYFLRDGENSVVYTHSFTFSRGGASTNYSTIPNNRTMTGLSDLPEDKYEWWLTYTDTDGTKYNTTRSELRVECDSAPGVTYEEATGEGVGTSNKVIALVVVLAALYFVFRKK